MFHFDTKPISRSKNESVIHRSVYITGRSVTDINGNIIKHPRTDVLWQEILLPPGAPAEYANLQTLTEAMELSEIRKNARTARQYIANLPKELPVKLNVEIVKNFVAQNFTANGLCVIAAIHDGKNEISARNNNPHTHILVSTRVIRDRKFGAKYRILDTKSNLSVLRSRWAALQNREYERLHLSYRVSPDKQYIHEHELSSPEHSR